MVKITRGSFDSNRSYGRWDIRLVLQIHGGVAILGVHLFLLLHLHLPPSIATPDELSDEESKSLWHQMADSMSVVSSDDRDRFLDLCLKRRIMCDNARFMGVKPDFQWRSGITQSAKDRFWHSYTCTYNRDIKQCPVDGLWSSWSPWSRCGATCDAKGNQTRTRTCSNPVPVRGGDRCHGSMMRSRPCLGSCSDPSKGGGVEEAEAFLKEVHEAYPDLMHDCYDSHCTYGVVKRVVFEPHVRAKYWSSLSCVKYGGACPVDGKWGVWSEWSQCSLKCGTGSRTRIRTCDQPPPNFGGHPCTGSFHEEQSCIMKDCGATTTETFTEWTKWSSCSISCGGYGIQTATMVCLRHAGCDLMGVLTPYVNRSRPCYPGDCPNQGGWSEWTDWTECSAACGAGRQSRLRLCDSPFPTGGLYCMADPLDFRLCKGDSCAGQPSPSENTAYRRKPGQEDEDVLIGKSDEYLNGPLNPNMESTFNPWTPWSPCSASCGTGTRQRNRWCSVSSTPLPPCEGEVQQIQFCNVFVCPVVGGWGVWMPWTPCAVTCGKGKRQRYRQCNNPLPQYGGSCDGDGMRVENCDMGNCPRVAGGSWSKWTQWSVCTVTCGGGERARQRSRQRSNGQSNGFSSFGQPGSLQQDQQEAGSKERLTCNAQPCPVEGSWAEWAEWSRCSSLCGMGRRTRDRTCTDPAPIFAGTACLGPGTDLAHCFAGPCKDAEDRALRMGPTSWIRYAPRNRPSRFLVLYLHFKPMEPSGSLLRRYRQCRSVFDDEDEDKDDTVDDEDKANDNADRKADADEKCQFMVNLKLEQAEVILSAQVRGATLEIRSPVTLSLGAWHELLVEVMKSGASLRVNNHERLYANFSRTLVKDLDFDSYMSIGAMDNDTAGMVGSISTVSVNFRTQDLFAATDWEGQGTPVSRHAVSVQSINPSIQLPHFRGIYYSPIRMYHTERLTVRLTLALDREEGLLLYARGQSEDTLFSLGIKKTRPIICVVCSPSIGNVCHQGDLLRLHQWYHFSLHVEDNEAELRVDQGKAMQLTCKGLPYRPRKVLYVGGRSALVWDDVQRATNYTEGFFGVLGTVVVNGRTVPFRQAVLMGRDDRINPDGYSRATRITPVFEHKTSIVTLHCEIAKPVDPLTEVKVIWLRSDAVLEPSDFVEIIKPVGIEKLVGTLQLQPGGHTEGIYSCVISRDGILELAHVFPVFRHATTPDLYESNLEWLFLKILLILLPLLAILCLLYRFRQFFFNLYNKCFGKRPLEEEIPMLTEPMPVFMPEKAHLHGKDGAGVWDSYLATKGRMETVEVASYGPPEPRQLTVTPGTATERPTVVSEGQLKLGDTRRASISNYSAADDPVVQMRRMSQGMDPFEQLPGDLDRDSRHYSRYENFDGGGGGGGGGGYGGGGSGGYEPMYENLSYNRNPCLERLPTPQHRKRSRSSSERRPFPGSSKERRVSISPARHASRSRNSRQAVKRSQPLRYVRNRSHSADRRPPSRRGSSSRERSLRSSSRSPNAHRSGHGTDLRLSGIQRDRLSRSRSNNQRRRSLTRPSGDPRIDPSMRKSRSDAENRHRLQSERSRQSRGNPRSQLRYPGNSHVSRRQQSVSFRLPRNSSNNRTDSSSRRGFSDRNSSALRPGGTKHLSSHTPRGTTSLPQSSPSLSSSDSACSSSSSSD